MLDERSYVEIVPNCFIGYERSTLEGPGSTAQMMKLAILLTMTLLKIPSALVDTHYLINKIYI